MPDEDASSDLGQVVALVGVGLLGFALSLLIATESSVADDASFGRGLAIACASWLAGAAVSPFWSGVAGDEVERPPKAGLVFLVSGIAIAVATGVKSDLVPWLFSVACAALSGWISFSSLLDVRERRRIRHSAEQ